MIKLNLFKNKEFSNAKWIIGQQIFQMIVSLVVGVLSARYLGPSNYGALNYTASFINFFISITTLGMDSVIIKKIIDYPNEEGEYLGTCLIFRVFAAVLSMASSFLLVFILNPNDNIKWILVFLQSFQLLFRALQLFDSWFQRYLQSKYVSIGKMIACMVVAGYKIYLLTTQKSIIWFALSNSITDFIIIIILFYFYHKVGGTHLRIKWQKGKEVLKESYHFIISGIMTAIYSQMDRIMIGSMLTDIDVGLYTTATAISEMWIFVPIAIINSFQPKIMELKKNKDEIKYNLRLKQLYSGIIWLCIFVSVIVSIFAYIIIKLLYGDQYLGAVSTLRISIWCETFAMIGTARGIWILCENKNKYVKYYLGIGAVINLILNGILIPSFGINGAAMATLMTQIITSLIAPLLFKETRYHTIIVLQSITYNWFLKKKNRGNYE